MLRLGLASSEVGRIDFEIENLSSEMSGTQFETIDLRVAVFLGRLNGQVCCLREKLAGATGLEPAASCVTGRRVRAETRFTLKVVRLRLGSAPGPSQFSEPQ
jgi:hypothetical protein